MPRRREHARISRLLERIAVRGTFGELRGESSMPFSTVRIVAARLVAAGDASYRPRGVPSMVMRCM